VDIGAELQLGLQHYNAARLVEAEACFRRVLSVQPKNPDALQLLGLLAHRVGRHEDAVTLIGRAIQLIPNIAEFHNNLGEAQRALGRADDALVSYRTAVALKPELAAAQVNLGTALAVRREFQDAMAHLRRAIELRPRDSSAWNSLGETFRMLANFPEAERCYREAIRLSPERGEAYLNLAKVLQNAGALDEAAATCRLGLERAPNDVGGHVVLGNILQAQGRVAEAIDSYHAALRLDPSAGVIYFNLASALRSQGLIDKSIATFRQGIKLRPDMAMGHSGLLLTLHYDSRISPAEIFSEHLAWATRHAEPLTRSAATITPHVSPRDRRLRIGYVSPDFREHAVAHFIEPVLELHDREQFQVFCYADQFRTDDITLRLQRHANVWRNVTSLSDEQLAAQIRDDDIDVLIDLAGHTADNRLLTFARRPAPVQATYLGYPGTTGMTAMDWRITDALADAPRDETSSDIGLENNPSAPLRYAAGRSAAKPADREPEATTDALHTERLMRLDGCAWCYRPPTDAPPVASRPSDAKIVFGSFNALAKISVATIDAWSELLRALPHASLLIKSTSLEDAAVRDRYHAAFAAHGIDPARVQLLGAALRFTDHLATYGRVDIALDTFPYNGTTTTCEALWMGVPVVTLAGKSHVSRVGVSLLTHVGLPNLIAHSPAELINIATTLAVDRSALRETRATLREKMRASSLLDARRLMSQLQSAYRRIASDD
jgi:protein O-GlcNAc transferase